MFHKEVQAIKNGCCWKGQLYQQGSNRYFFAYHFVTDMKPYDKILQNIYTKEILGGI